jgi:hypothetical protein
MPRLEIDIDVDNAAAEGDGMQVSGTLIGPDGARPFVGWVGLLALLQQAVTVPDPSAQGQVVIP